VAEIAHRVVRLSDGRVASVVVNDHPSAIADVHW
jgi:hypothetical protein